MYIFLFNNVSLSKSYFLFYLAYTYMQTLIRFKTNYSLGKELNFMV